MCVCHGCKRQYSIDLIVPDDVWVKIYTEDTEKAKDGGGLLCPECINTRMSALGNLTKVISVMSRYKGKGVFSPYMYQEGFIVYTEEELVKSGNKASLSGIIAVSPEFKLDGGEIDTLGAPIYDEHVGPDALSLWLGISAHEVRLLDVHDLESIDTGFSKHYNKAISEITEEDVISKLQDII